MKIKGGKFLITGGASMIGAHITEQLLAADAAEIVLFDNFSLGSPEGISDLVENPRVKDSRAATFCASTSCSTASMASTVCLPPPGS